MLGSLMVQLDGLNQSVLLTGLQKANKKFQPNLGTHKSISISIEVKDLSDIKSLRHTYMYVRISILKNHAKKTKISKKVRVLNFDIRSP